MAHRAVLTARQRAALFDLPTEEMALLRHYTLDDEDIEHIRTRRRPENQIGFALQLCAFRFPGRLLKAGEVIPEPGHILSLQVNIGGGRWRKTHETSRASNTGHSSSMRRNLTASPKQTDAALCTNVRSFRCFQKDENNYTVSRKGYELGAS